MAYKSNTVEVPAITLEQIRPVLRTLRRLSGSTPRELTPTSTSFVKGLLRFALLNQRLNDDAKFTVTDLRHFFAKENECRSTKRRYPTTTSSLMRRLKDLETAGVFHAFKIGQTPSGSTLKNFRLAEIHEPTWHTLQYLENQQAKQFAHSQRRPTIHTAIRLMKASNDYLIRDLTDTRSKSDGFFTGCLDRGMRATEKEVHENNEIHTTLKIKNVTLSIITTAHYQIATRSDQRIIRAIITLISRQIDDTFKRYNHAVAEKVEAKEAHAVIDSRTGRIEQAVAKPDPALKAFSKPQNIVPNDFYIDVFDIARLCFYANNHNRATVRSINRSIRRLYDTNFLVHLSGSSERDLNQVMAMFGLPMTGMDFRFITDLKSLRAADDIGGNTRDLVHIDETHPFSVKALERVRLWQISIDKTLYAQLLDPEQRRLYRAHDEIMSDRRGLSQSMYNYFCSIIGRTAPPKGQRETAYNKPLRILRDTLWPTCDYKRFENEFMGIMKAYSSAKGIVCTDDSVCDLPVFGFLFTVTRVYGGELHVRVRRNKKDPLAGDHSFHNRALYSDQRDLFS